MSARQLRAAAGDALRPAGRNVLWDTLVCCCAPLFASLLANLLTFALERAASGASGGIGASALRSAYFSAHAALYLLSLAAGLLAIPLALSFKFVMLRRVRGESAGARDRRRGFSLFFRALVLHILTGLSIALWTCVFVVPGLVAAYRYRFAPYLLCDHPEYSPSRALRESSRLARGHKRTLLRLDLSFFYYFIPLGAAQLLMNLTSLEDALSPYCALPSLGYEQALFAFAVGVVLCAACQCLCAARHTCATAALYDHLAHADADPVAS